jgi:hypothetical protein
MGSSIVRLAVKLVKKQAVKKNIVMPSIVLDKALMTRIQSGKASATVGLKASVRSAVAGCK